ncbi:DUF4269 domain-containing protein [Paenibacillus flagellatus]|uniref:DUF4269 domain-containing protein n=1 Tax=Paenibacillus flagellatus TaxID=2211139 RepID=A0A2V5K4V3_9BACL|nr:DUF4269 domain-containing protein [Paenibacillus flagellatus]PYI54248.1 DUF4269 domain-containing protein [Paenibacillus flagellatus]
MNGHEKNRPKSVPLPDGCRSSDKRSVADLPAASRFDADRLRSGTPAQRGAYERIVRYRLLESLQPFRPIVVGTIPIDIDIEGSDLDIACETSDFDAFARTAEQCFGGLDGFVCKRKPAKSGRGENVVVRFVCDGLPVELYAEAKPVLQQNGYVHMSVEHRLLELHGERLKGEIRRLKREGLKTEPAFARYFRLDGDPYEALLMLSDRTDDQLRKLSFDNRAFIQYV